MSKRRNFALATAVCAASMAAWAGHLNTVLEAELDGREEVGATRAIAGDPDGRGEAYVFGIDGDPTTLCYVLTVKKIGELDQAPGGGRAAHIHRGSRGTNGPVVVNLAWPQNGQAADCLTEGEVLASGAAAFPVVPALGRSVTVQEILGDPNAFYVNVHNAEYPGGALRGQLSPAGD